METRLPSYIKQTKLLQFDSNFESGNLDSAYLVNDMEYNLLCKVDTNTKGNTYWFYFKVLNWKPKAFATFNVLNVARDLVPFYNKGMQIWTRCESSNGKYKSDWECSTNVRVVSFQPNDIVRSTKQKKEYAMGRNYHTLKFRCEFPEISMLKTPVQSNFDDTSSVNPYAEVGPNDQGALGTVFCFAYALPYTYTDLVSDLQNCKKFLLKNSGIIVNELNQIQSPKKLHIKPKPVKLVQTSPVQFSQNEEDGLMTPSTLNKISRRFQQDEDRPLLTKNQIAQRELKKEALRFVKGRMGQFEIQLLKADEEIKEVIKNRKTQKGPKLLEIHTDYLYYKQEIISQSVGGLNVYQITLTKRTGPNCVPYHKKKCMYITARMHSAETCSSFIMKSIMQELVTKAEKYDLILNNYIVKLVPLINPDGVTIGNSRSSLVGLDLNRRWAEPNASIHPEIYFLKKIMQQQANQQQGISIFCDLHGHNRKENCFFYGCNKAADEGMLSWTKTRLLPKIMASVEQIFDFSSCKFRQDKFKLNTARVVVWNEMKVTNSFTLETSMFAKTINKIPLEAAAITSSINSMESKIELSYIQLKIQDLNQIAKSFLVSCAQYSKLEKEIEKECSLQYGWFKPSKLNEFAGEAARDKQKREATQKSKAIKEKARDTTRKQSERLNSSSFAEPTRRRVTKLNSGNKVLLAEQKISTTNVIVRPKAKRQQSLINVVQGMQGSNEKTRQDKNTSNNLNVHLDEFPKTSKKLKGPKVAAIQQEMTENGQINDTGQSSVVMKLKSWKEFFDVEEFQRGVAHMSKPLKKALTELSEKASSGSDSEPSIDNFDQQELHDNLCEALDLQEGDPDPFERPFPMKNQKPSIKISEPSDEDLQSMEDMNDPTEITKEAPIQDDESMTAKQASSVLVTSTELQMEEPSISGVLVSIYKGRRQQNNEKKNTKILDQNARYHQQTRAPNSRGASFPSNLEQERFRLLNHPDLANQLINQLILQQNARQMKASAAPPSGTEKNSTNQIKQTEFAQNHVLRGFRCINQAQNCTKQVLATENSTSEHTKYMTEQHRRMIVQRQPQTQFTVLGQGVSSLNNSTIQDSTVVSARKQARKIQSTIKGLTPLPTKQLGQVLNERGSQGKLASTQDTHADARQTTQGSRKIFNSESRHTSRLQHDDAVGNAQNIFMSTSQANSSQLASYQKGLRMENVRIEKSSENISQRNQMNESQRSASSKHKKPKTIRTSKEQRYQTNSDHQKLVLEQQRVKEAHKNYEQQQQISVGQYYIKFNVDQLTGNVSYDSSLENRQILEIQKQQNIQKFPNNGRYSQVRKNFIEGNNISPGLTSQYRGAGDKQFIHQQLASYSPLQQDGLSKNQVTPNQLSSPPHYKKVSFRTPRYLKLVRPADASNTVARPPLGESYDENLIPEARSTNVTKLNEQEISQIESQGNQTWYSGSGFVDSLNNRASSSNRKMSHINPSMNQQKLVMAVNGFELHKNLVMRQIKYSPIQGESTENRVALYQQEMPASDKASKNRHGHRVSNSQVTSEKANERVTPILGNGLNKNQVKIRKGRNLHQTRPDSLEESGQFMQKFGGTIDDLKKLRALTENTTNSVSKYQPYTPVPMSPKTRRRTQDDQ